MSQIRSAKFIIVIYQEQKSTTTRKWAGWITRELYIYEWYKLCKMYCISRIKQLFGTLMIYSTEGINLNDLNDINILPNFLRNVLAWGNIDLMLP